MPISRDIDIEPSRDERFGDGFRIAMDCRRGDWHVVFYEKEDVLFSVYIDGIRGGQDSLLNEIEILAGDKLNDILNAEYIHRNCWFIVEDFKRRQLMK